MLRSCFDEHWPNKELGNFEQSRKDIGRGLNIDNGGTN